MSNQELADWMKQNRQSLGIEMDGEIEVVAVPKYIYSNGWQCNDAYCGGMLDSPVTGSYLDGTIKLYKPAFEPGLTSSSPENDVALGPSANPQVGAQRLTPVENAVTTYGHEAAHSRGIDRLPPNVPHPAAEAAGLRALDRFRVLYCGGKAC